MDDKKSIRLCIAALLAAAHVSASRDSRLDSAEQIALDAVERADAIIKKTGGLD